MKGLSVLLFLFAATFCNAQTKGILMNANGQPYIGNTNDSLPLYSLSVLSKTGPIDFKNTGTTNLYTVPSGKTAIITGILIRSISASAVTVVAQGSVGTNATSYNNITSTIGFTGLSATNKVYQVPLNGSYNVASAGEIIKGNITVGAIATSLTCEVWLIGVLF